MCLLPFFKNRYKKVPFMDPYMEAAFVAFEKMHVRIASDAWLPI